MSWIRYDANVLISIQEITAESDLFVRRRVTAVYNNDYTAFKANGSRKRISPAIETILTANPQHIITIAMIHYSLLSIYSPHFIIISLLHSSLDIYLIIENNLK